MIFRILSVVALSATCLSATPASLDNLIFEAMADRCGACVFVDCTSGRVFASDSTMAAIRFTPCSTFKIWNTLIGVECRFISDPDELFYKWDGKTRFLPAWNKDLTLKEAFRESCVPAFQNLARRIGYENMKKWIALTGYGDKDISSGIDDFWLPREGKKSIRISPIEQAQLIRKLVNGDLPFSSNSCALLKDMMIVGTTTNGRYFGKTGTGTDITDSPKKNIAWFVGYVISKDIMYSYACLIIGEHLSGTDSKAIIESILLKAGLI